MSKSLTLNYTLPDCKDHELEDAVEAILLDSQSDFTKFFSELLPEDARYSVVKGNMKVEDIEANFEDSGQAAVTFDYEYYDGCKDRNFVDSEEAQILFEISNGILSINMPYPMKWDSNDGY